MRNSKRGAAESARVVDPARSVELLWGRRSGNRPGPKPKLTVSQIAQAAIELADADGLAALSMPQLAKRLGVGTMSLYRYVTDKSELVDLVIDAAIGPPPRFRADGWRPRLESWAVSILAIFDRHPWILEVLVARRAMGPNEMAWFEAALEAVADTGLGAQEMADVVLLVNRYVLGQAYASVAAGAAQRTGVCGDEWADAYVRALADVIDERRYPHVSELLATSVFVAQPERQFEFGLARVLDSIGSFIDQRTSVSGGRRPAAGRGRDSDPAPR
ncbi:TetR/AcrR family transcriptional regulator [Nocardia donostiensis]|uniref:TetR/AcrR family transcriptional regulator n=1 Tax=Nocardia donostiensis TaxID=1538463 RepID=UPI00158B97A9|nr:TetR/AcrR family transcriptional regulator [Nocardia donostiensis]